MLRLHDCPFLKIFYQREGWKLLLPSALNRYHYLNSNLVISKNNNDDDDSDDDEQLQQSSSIYLFNNNT